MNILEKITGIKWPSFGDARDLRPMNNEPALSGRGMRGRVSRTNVVRGGEVSVTIRFGLEDRAQAVELSTGKLVAVIVLEQPAIKPSSPDGKIEVKP